MNAPLRPEGLVKHQFTIDEVLRLTADGLLDQRTQLLDGDIYHMGSDGDRHISHSMRLARIIGRALEPDAFFVGVQTTLRLSNINAPSPDIYVLAGDPPQGSVPCDRILLVIEVADTSLKDNLTDSASRYARHNIDEYWVVDVNARVIHVHRGPKDGVYPPPRVYAADETITPSRIPELNICLSRDVPERA